MKKELKPTKLHTGDQVFYYDGYTSFNIEEVMEVNKKENWALLSNNAYITRESKEDGTFSRVNKTKSVLPTREKIFIKKNSPELEKVRKAILAYLKLNRYIQVIKSDILNKADLKQWDKWSVPFQDKLINICGHVNKALEGIELTEEEEILLNESLFGIPEVKPKRKRKR